MKKLLAFLLVVTLSFSVVGCSNDEQTETGNTDIKQTGNIGSNEPPSEEKPMNGVFRYANWGDSVDAIVRLEGDEYYAKTDEGLGYENIRLMTYNTSVTYIFNENGFCGGMYTIEDTHTNENSYIDDFNNINGSLIEKYGNPITNEVNWTREIFKNDPGLALRYGDVEYNTSWENDNIGVIHILSGDNYKIKHTILYFNPNDTTTNDTTGL